MGILVFFEILSAKGDMMAETNSAAKKGKVASNAYLKKSQSSAASPAMMTVMFAALLYSLSVRIPPSASEFVILLIFYVRLT